MDSNNNDLGTRQSLEKARKYFVKDFLNYLAIERNLLPRTIKEYEHDLKIFFNYFKPFLENELTLESMDERTIREFLTYLIIEKNYTPRALNRKLSTLKAYFKFLEQEEYISKTPLGRTKSVKMGRHFPKVFTITEVNSILNVFDSEDKNDTNQKPITGKITKKRAYKMPFDASVRDQAILELFYATGMRISELTGLNLEDVDFEGMMIKVTGKGNKQRMVIINETAKNALLDWLKIKPASDKALFINRNGKRITQRGIQKMFKKRLDQAGISHNGSPHTMRHSFATHLLEGGADLVSIKELLGHENLSTTQIYTNIAMARIKKVYKESHPRK